MPSEQALLPDTPAGRQMAMFVETFNHGDVQTIQQVIAAHYADPAADKGPQDDRAVWNSMDYTTTLVDALRYAPGCGLRVATIEKSTPEEIGVLAQVCFAGEWVYLKMRVSPERPHRLIELRTRPSQPPPAEPTAAIMEDNILISLEAFLENLSAADIFSGAVMVSKNGEPVFQRAYGFASREFEVPNRIDTKFNVGSLNKMFTAVGIAQLVERGLLRFEATIADYLPDYPQPVARKVTLHQLLTHMSGIGSYWNDQFECERARIRTVTDFMELFMHEPPVYEPGTRWFYSNGGYVILGAIIERVTGQDYYDAMREHVYRPVGMINTDAFEMDRPVPNLATGYTHIDHMGDRELGPYRNNLFLHVIKGGPGGGGFSTVEDLLRFDAALRNNTLLSAPMTQNLLSGKVEVRGFDHQYAYGFHERRLHNQRIVGHHGNFPGIGSQFDMFMEAGYTVAILSNVDPCVSQVVANYTRDLVTRGAEMKWS